MIHTLTSNLLASAAPAHGETHAGPAQYGGGEQAVASSDLAVFMNDLLMLTVQAGVGVLILGILLCLYRMIRGPHLADRVLAGDVIAMLVAGLVILLSIQMGSTLYYDAAMVVAIVGFASTVAFAQYIGAKNKYADDLRMLPDTGSDA